MVLGHLLPSTQQHFFFQWALTSLEYSLSEFYTILLEEHLQLALRMSEVGYVAHFSLQKWPDWFNDVQIWWCARQWLHLYALQTTTEQFQLCDWELSSWKIAALFENNDWVLGCTWRVIMGPHYHITATLLSKLSENLPSVALLEPGIHDFRLPCVFPKRKRFKTSGTEYRMTHLTISHVSICVMSSSFCGDAIIYASEHYVH
jgi:hypothetical protein